MKIFLLCHRFSKGSRGRELVSRRRQQWCSVTRPANQPWLSSECRPSTVPFRCAHPEWGHVPPTGTIGGCNLNHIIQSRERVTWTYSSKQYQIRRVCPDDHTINKSNIFSVHYTVPSSISSSTTSSPGEWVRLLHLSKNNKWDHGDLGKLPPLNWTGQGMEKLVIFSHKSMKYLPASSLPASCRFDDLWINLTLISICGAAITG